MTDAVESVAAVRPVGVRGALACVGGARGPGGVAVGRGFGLLGHCAIVSRATPVLADRPTCRTPRCREAGLLTLADPERLRVLAGAILAEIVPAEQDLAATSAQNPAQGHAAPAPAFQITPSTGVLVGQVRETIASQRFIAGDLDAEVLRGGGRTADIIELALATDEHLRAERAAEWERLTPTIVEFEEIA